jgi:hypothetical protein
VFRHPEVLGAQRRASKDDGLGASAASFEARFRSRLRMTVSVRQMAAVDRYFGGAS